MKIDVLTLFPNMFNNFLEESIIKRALNNKLVEINIIDFRKFSHLNNHQVDDTPYGGGGGMVLRCEPIFEAIDSIRTDDSKIILLTPDGTKYDQSQATFLTQFKHIILICGHYEGFDERIRSLADYEISIGDFVLTGGELPAMIIIDSVTRLIKNVINENSLVSESFTNNLLDYPTYTKPAVYRDMKVPDVLLSGDHNKIAQWRKEQQLKKTSLKRPDLLDK